MSSDDQITTLLRALVALQIADRQERIAGADDPRPTDVVLADAGLALGDIAQLTGRNYEAVKTTIRRARQSKPRTPARKKAKEADA
jgi:DNA-directed RNA polymerase specialized sigma24 family protein